MKRPQRLTLFLLSALVMLAIVGVAAARSMLKPFAQELAPLQFDTIVGAATLTHDGRTLAIGSFRNRVVLVSANDGTMVTHVDVGAGDSSDETSKLVQSIAFSPDGSILAAGGWDGLVRLWSIADSKVSHSLDAHAGAVNAIAFSPDGQVVAAGYDKTIVLWRARDGAVLATLQGHDAYINSLAFSPSSRMLASGSSDHTVRLWDVRSATLARELSGHSDIVTSVAFSPDGQFLASGGHDKGVRIWNSKNGDLVKIIEAHAVPMEVVVFGPNGNLLATGDRNSAIRFWTVPDGTVLDTLESDEPFVRDIINTITRTHSVDNSVIRGLFFSPDGQILFSFGSKSVRKWRIKPTN